MSAAVPYIPMILSLASNFLSSKNQSEGESQRGEYETRNLNRNADIADAQADDALARGENDAEAHRRRVKLLIGEQRAKMGAQGLDLGGGSALDVQLDTAGLGAEDIARIKNNAFSEAWGYRMQAEDYRDQAQLANSSAGNRARNSILGGAVDAIGQGFEIYQATKQNTKSKTTKKKK